MTAGYWLCFVNSGSAQIVRNVMTLCAPQDYKRKFFIQLQSATTNDIIHIVQADHSQRIHQNVTHGVCLHHPEAREPLGI